MYHQITAIIYFQQDRYMIKNDSLIITKISLDREKLTPFVIFIL